MNTAKRQAAFDRLLVAHARAAAARLGARYLGTITKLPPPPLPGDPIGRTRYYANTLSKSGASLVEISGPASEALRRGEKWVATAGGTLPKAPKVRPHRRPPIHSASRPQGKAAGQMREDRIGR